ncbi:ATP-dependent RNA helicase, DHX29-like protein [Schizosaccharomyces osmophilus]|uniref:RNA helicase n=1 Tax=Schizosaccharomyces osmophilus TaxID=2545709 RepID=A0AAF0AUR4_9SCHI|nr:ATP-dependent RNA helicase, DHX29-like protein [Schizosaccharomyces osmophilus]WBW71164.1 ATP-dependent RNA helicase, DHX29-like protein [Schizosaccharomyces osmophilus]
MAKKKSKASSSARGYATTSIPSRATPVPKKAENNDVKKSSKVDAAKETPATIGTNDPVNSALHETNSFDDLLTEESSPSIDTESEKLKSAALSTSKSFLHAWQTELRLRKSTNIMSFSDDENKLIYDSFRDSWIDSLKKSANQSNSMAYASKKRLLWSTFLSLLDMGFSEDLVFKAFSSLPVVSIEDYIAWIITEPTSLENPHSFNYEIQPTNYLVFCRHLDEPLPAAPVPTSNNKRLAPLMTKKEPIEPPSVIPKSEASAQDEENSKDGDAYSMASLLQQLPEEEDMPGNDPYDLTNQYVKAKMKILRLQIMGQKDSDATDMVRAELEGITSQYLFSSKDADSVLKRKRGEFMSKLKALQAKASNERAVKALQNQKPADQQDTTEDTKSDSDGQQPGSDQAQNDSDHEDQQSRVGEDTDLMGGLFNEPEESSVVVDTDQSNYTYLPLSMDRSGTRPSTILQYELHKLGNNLHAEYKTYPIGQLGWQSTCFVKCPTGQKTFIDTETVLPSPVLASDYTATHVLFKLVSPYTKLTVTMFPKSFKDLFEKLLSEQSSGLKQEDMRISEKLDDILESKGSESTGVQNKASSKSVDTAQTKKAVHRPPEKIVEEWHRQLCSSNAEKFRDIRSQLPASRYKSEILEAVNNNQLLIISGDTGCGKSTQIPAFLLEDALSQGESAKIYVTEPRRISAVSLAQRVSQELGAHPPSNRSHEMVGYSVRLDSKSTMHTPLVYVTTGVFLRLLEVGDEIESVTHLIIDEVHERSIDSDLLLIHVLRLLNDYPKLKVIVMSATLNAEKFQDYFGGSSLISIPGKTYPVQRCFLEDIMQQFQGDISFGENNTDVADENDEYEEDEEGEDKDPAKSDAVVQNPIPKSYNEKVINYNLILFLLKYVFTEGDPKYSQCVLVFFPGISEILRMKSLIDDVPMFQKHRDFRVYILHSSLSSAQQQSVFEIPPRGCRKIVLSTNIAETGVTIPDVTCVIDTGVHREMRYNSKRHLSRLTDTFVSRANAKQRSGRAGRVQEGICYHLFSKYKHDTQFLSYQTPEMLRLNLQEVVLRVKVCQMGEVQNVLGNALDAPSSTNVGRALEKLQQLGAIGEFEKLTKLGKYLAQLPLDATLGKLLVLGCYYKSVDAIVSIVAMITIGSPFRKPVGLEFAANKARLSFAKENTRSDLLVMYYAYCAWRDVCLNKLGPTESEFTREKYLNVEALSMAESLKIQLLNELKDMRLISATSIDTCKAVKRSICRRFAIVPESSNLFSDNAEMVSSIIGASLYPNILKYDFEKRYWTSLHTNKRIRILDVSVNNKSELYQMPSKIVAYTNMMSSTRASEYVAETTMVTIRMLLSMCGLRIDLRESIGQAKLDRFTVYLDNVYTSSALHMLRSFIESSFATFLSHPEVYLSDEQLAVIASLVSRLSFNRVQKQKFTA